ncbi:hypothetical protein PCE1_002905 [Barthelona sp. PCE]
MDVILRKCTLGLANEQDYEELKSTIQNSIDSGTSLSDFDFECFENIKIENMGFWASIFEKHEFLEQFSTNNLHYLIHKLWSAYKDDKNSINTRMYVICCMFHCVSVFSFMDLSRENHILLHTLMRGLDQLKDFCIASTTSDPSITPMFLGSMQAFYSLHPILTDEDVIVYRTVFKAFIAAFWPLIPENYSFLNFFVLSRFFDLDEDICYDLVEIIIRLPIPCSELQESIARLKEMIHNDNDIKELTLCTGLLPSLNRFQRRSSMSK